MVIVGGFGAAFFSAGACCFRFAAAFRRSCAVSAPGRAGLTSPVIFLLRLSAGSLLLESLSPESLLVESRSIGSGIADHSLDVSEGVGIFCIEVVAPACNTRKAHCYAGLVAAGCVYGFKSKFKNLFRRD